MAADTCLVLTVLTQNITLGLDPIILSSPLRTARLLNVILLLGCLLKTFIDIFDIMFLSLLSYVLTLLFNMYRLLFTVISSLVAFSACCLQCFDAVGWAAGRASGL